MAEASGRLRLTPETIDEYGVGGELLTQHLDRHDAIKLCVKSAIDDSDAAFTQLVEKLVSPVQACWLHDS